jgi:hypothetical protein
MIVHEMTQWIQNQPDHIVVLHESPLAQLITTCLITTLNREIFDA